MIISKTVISSKHSSTCTVFDNYNHVLPLAGNDVIVISPLGALKVIHYMDSGRPTQTLFILVFNNNDMSIMHSFRFNQVFPLAGNAVIVLSPQGGGAAEFYVRILKGQQRLYISVY